MSISELSTNHASRRWLGLVLLFAVALRLGWGITRPSDATSIERLPDQREYLELAENLLHGRGLVMHDPRFAGPVYAYRTPGYPLLIALCGARPSVVRSVQALIDVSTALAVYFLARRMFADDGIGERLSPNPHPSPLPDYREREKCQPPFPSAVWPLLAAAFVAINPYQIYFSGLLLSEALFTAMLAWGMALMSWRRYGSGALLLALAVLVRPSGLYLPLLMALAASILNCQIARPYFRVRHFMVAMIAALVTLVVLLPWAMRNHRILGDWIWTTTNGGITLYDGFNPNATGASDQRFTTQMPTLQHAGELQRDRILREQAIDWARHHPLRVVQLTIAKLLRTWSPIPLSSEFSKGIYRWIGGLWAVPFDLLIILGLCCGRLSRTAKVFLLLPAIYLSVVHAASVGSLRYRIPAEAPMAVLAVAGCQVIAARMTAKSI